MTAIALFFAVSALRYTIGDLGRSGPGMFPLIVSGLLLVLAVISIVQSHVTDPVPLYFDMKNIGLILAGLVLFVAASRFLNMLVGIVLMIFVVGLAARTYSWKRNLQISIGLTAVALIFERVLGLNLRLV